MIKQKTKGEDKPARLPIAIAGGVLIACAITAIAIVVCALLLTYTSMEETKLPLIITVVCAASAVAAGFDAARAASEKGWLWGIVAGGIYAVVLICMEVFVSGGVSFDTRTVTLLVLSLAGGGLGGIIGINFRKKKRFR